MDQSKLPLPFILTSCNTNLEFINTPQELKKVATPLKSSDGALKTELNIGLLPTLGLLLGVKMVSSES